MSLKDWQANGWLHSTASDSIPHGFADDFGVHPPSPEGTAYAS